MKSSIKLLLVGLMLFSACGENSTLGELKSQKSKVEAEIKTMEAKLNALEVSIEELDSTSKEEKLELVTVIDLAKGEFNNYIEAQGKTYTENNVMVTTDMGGLVTRVLVNEGQYVSKGKTLIQLDNSVILSQLAELETNITLAKDVFDKRQRLWDQKIGSEIEYLQAKNNYESLNDKKGSINTQLSKTSIQAPISGYIESISLKLGEMASPGMPACQVVNNSKMEVRIDLPEVYLGKVKKGDIILVDLPALGIEKSAKVTSVGQIVSTYNRAFQIIAAIENSKGEIKPNMLVKAKFTNESVKDAITIPTSLLQESSKGYFVYTATIDTLSMETIAVKKVIEVGESYGGNILVTSGLGAEDVIINEGFRNVLDGQFIHIQK
ncbi:MAG: membrane fusion protein (multidrug efflux system) [Chitinophagales bacterium]|jgi:membrane fusion protein (multidrug efflux system)